MVWAGVATRVSLALQGRHSFNEDRRILLVRVDPITLSWRRSTSSLPANVPLLEWLDARRDGPFDGQAFQWAFPGVPFATLKEELELAVKS